MKPATSPKGGHDTPKTRSSVDAAYNLDKLISQISRNKI